MAEFAGAVVPKQFRQTSKINNQPIYPNVVQLQAYAVNKVLERQWTKAQAQSFVDSGLEIAVESDTPKSQKVSTI